MSPIPESAVSARPRASRREPRRAAETGPSGRTRVPAPAPPRDVTAGPRPVRIFFFADTHAGFALTDKFIAETNREKPDLVLDGGDIVEEGTQAEFRKAYADRSRLAVPLRMVTGNHDVLRSGPFTEPPPVLPDFQSFDHQGVHIVMLDDQNQTLSEAQFAKLEADLEANKGKTTIVAMHVPPLLGDMPGLTGLKRLIPYKSVSLTMRDPQQVERLEALMKKYQVAAVLAGHVHGPSEKVVDGTRYVTVGAVGGRPVGPGIPHEYLDVTVRGRDVQIRRVPLDHPARDPLSYMYNVGVYTARKSAFNHAALGWDEYIPRDDVQLRAGTRLSSTRRGDSQAATLGAAIEVTPGSDAKARNALFAESTLAVGPRELSADLAGGYKRRLVGDFNRNWYASGAAVVNGGIIAGAPTAGIGARVGTGVEYKNWTLELSHEEATNRRATMLSVGFRF